jgi:hypothetical protein
MRTEAEVCDDDDGPGEDAPVIIASETAFTATWTVELAIEPGSVPDRAAPRAAAGVIYRPGALRMTFTVLTRHPDAGALRLESGSSYLAAARTAVRLQGISVYGWRLKKDGTPGGQAAVEDFTYGSIRLAPGWAQAAVAETLAALGSSRAEDHRS